MTLHQAAADGDLAAIEQSLKNGASVDGHDTSGLTPLMAAVKSPLAGIDVLKFLVFKGADVNAHSAPGQEELSPQSVLSLAVRSASLEKVRFLMSAGADVTFLDASSYSVLLRAIYQSFGCAEATRPIIEFLIEGGAPLDAASSYGETPLSVASIHADFELVRRLLARGANPAPLGWSPLHFAVALESAEEVARLLDEGAVLEVQDSWERTPFLLAVHAGRQDVAELLVARGAASRTRGRCGATAVLLAISENHAAILQWLIKSGCDIEEADEFGSFPLQQAVSENAPECVQVLLAAGANATRRDSNGHGIMSDASAPEMIKLLDRAGLDLSEVPSDHRNRLVGVASSEAIVALPEDYRAHRGRTFGKTNPERMNNSFWEAMIRTRSSGYSASTKFGGSSCDQGPVWCFSRFGQSLTRLPDGRYVEIAGEHEDHYDPDFCIYNDVVVHHGEGRFDIFGYPEADFPTTDFHSATLVWPHIYLIGNLGYTWQRQPGQTQVYRLNCENWRMEKIQTSGTKPGWIHGHLAKLAGGDRIEISGGKIADGTPQQLVDNTQSFALSLTTFSWLKSSQF